MLKLKGILARVTSWSEVVYVKRVAIVQKRIYAKQKNKCCTIETAQEFERIISRTRVLKIP